MPASSVTTWSFNDRSVFLDGLNYLTLATPLSLNTQANIFSNLYTFIDTNYVVWLNVANYSNLFANASFMQNFLNIDDVDVNLTLNSAWFINQLNSTNTSVIFNGYLTGETTGMEGIINTPINQGATTGGYQFTSVYSGSFQTLGYRLLEITAVNLFHHAKARAAIENDDTFVYGTAPDFIHGGTLYSSLANQLTISFQTDKHNIFNQYIELGRYTPGQNDVNVPVNFNFADLNMQVKLTFGVNTDLDPSTYPYYPANFETSILLVLTDHFHFPADATYKVDLGGNYVGPV